MVTVSHPCEVRKTLTAYRVEIHLGAKEYGNELMRELAVHRAAQVHARPLIVTVCEHAGWFLGYLFGAPGVPDGSICGTANDCAVLPQRVRDFGESIDRIKHLVTIWRE